MKGSPSSCTTLPFAPPPPPGSFLLNCIIVLGSCAGQAIWCVWDAEIAEGMPLLVSLLNIRFSQDTAIRCMQGYDAAIRFEVAPVFTGSNADKEGASG